MADPEDDGWVMGQTAAWPQDPPPPLARGPRVEDAAAQTQQQLDALDRAQPTQSAPYGDWPTAAPRPGWPTNDANEAAAFQLSRKYKPAAEARAGTGNQEAIADAFVPKTPLDYGLMLATAGEGSLAGAALRNVPKAYKMATLAAGAAMDAGDAQAGPIKNIADTIRAFHGSTERTLKEISSRNAIETRGATFHASNPDVAETFTVPREYGEPLYYDPNTGREIKRGRVYETSLTPKNMHEVPEADAQKFIDDSTYQQGVINKAKEAGHDAVVARNVLEGIGERHTGDVYAMLDDSAIKILRKYGITGVTTVGGLSALAGSSDNAEAAPRFRVSPGGVIDTVTNKLVGENPFRSGTGGQYGSWINKYDEKLPYVAGDTFHGLSGLRTSKPFDEMQFKILRPKAVDTPIVDIAELQRQKATLIPGVADRTAVGGRVSQVGDIKLPTPVDREGGIFYPHYHADTPVRDAPPEARRAFANAQGPATGLNDLAQREIERGRTPYFMPIAMGKGAGDSSVPVARVAAQVAQESDPNEAAVSYINSRMKELGRDDFPGVTSPRLLEWVNSTGGGARRDLVQALDMKSSRMGGVADMGEVRAAMTEPKLMYTPTGSGGLSLMKMDPNLGISAHSLHSTYPSAFMTADKSGITGLQGSVPWHTIAPDIHRGLMKYDPVVKYAERPTEYMMKGPPPGAPRVQRVTQQLVDKVSKFFEENPSGY